MATFCACSLAAASGSSARTKEAAAPQMMAARSAMRTLARGSVRPRSVSVSQLRMIEPSVREPEQQVQRVIIGRAASEPVVIAVATVELVVDGVLHGELHVEPRHVVHL